MKAFHVISTLLLIGVLSSVINAQVTPQYLGTAMLRVNPYVQNSSNVLCSGVFVNPWILLTAASCVDGKKSEELAAEVTLNGDGVVFNFYPVLVREIIFDPLYVRDESTNNFALLVLNMAVEWVLDPFLLPTDHYAPDTIVDKNMDTKIDRWTDLYTEKHLISREDKKITGDYSLCQGAPAEDYFFCAVYFSPHRKLTKGDIGTPLFYKDDKGKQLLGLFTGVHLNKNPEGYLYLDVYPRLDWIKDAIGNYPKPPLQD